MKPWTSLHIFQHEMSTYDALIVNISQLMDELVRSRKVNQWFFIRYWEGGPHLRLRIQTDQPEAIIEQVTDFTQGYWLINPSSLPPMTKDAYYEGHKFDGKEISMNDLPWYEDQSVHLIPYEPELARYGGADVMAYSENIFAHSSRLVAYLLSKMKFDPARRFILSLTLTRYLVEELLEFEDEEDNVQFCLFYQEYWESFVEGNKTDDLRRLFHANEMSVNRFYQLLNQNEMVKDCLVAMKQELQQIREQVRDELYLHRIVASHIHMANNRLGVSPFVEYYISEYLGAYFKSEEAKKGAICVEEPS